VYGFYTYLGVQLHADFGPAVVAGGLLIYGLAGVAGNIIGGRLSDRLGTRYLVPASQIGLACSLLVLAIGWPTPTPAVTIVGGAALTGYPAFPAHQARLSAAHPMQSANLLAGFRGVLLLSVGLALIATAASRRPVADGIDRRGTSSIGCQRTIQEHRA